MTETEIKEMLKDIIDNGAEYEFRWLRTDGWSDWKPYKLGNEICYNDSRYEYRKVEKWCVIYNMNMNLEICNKSKHPNLKKFEFEGTIQECEKWVEEHTKTSWLETYSKLFSVKSRKKSQIEACGIVCKDICEKILIEFQDNKTTSTNDVLVLQEIIKDLGVSI